MEKISNKFHALPLTIIIRFGDFCKHSIKPRKSWPNFLMFQSISILAICSNRRQEKVSVLYIRGTQRRFAPKYIENTVKALHSTFRSLEMHSKRPYKICTCSVILGELESFRNYKVFSIIFPKILDAMYCITKVGMLLVPLSITFLNPKILGFHFCTKN